MASLTKVMFILISLQVSLTHLLGSTAELDLCDSFVQKRQRDFSLYVEQLVNSILLARTMHKGYAVPSGYSGPDALILPPSPHLVN